VTKTPKSINGGHGEKITSRAHTQKTNYSVLSLLQFLGVVRSEGIVFKNMSIILVSYLFKTY
jgi:hypothetical protein